MKLCVTLLHVVALLSLAGSTRSDDATSTECIFRPDRDQGIHENINDVALDCLSVDRASIDHINEDGTLEGYKTFFKDFCDKKQEVLRCLAAVTQTSQVCDTETGHRFFLILRDLLQTLLDSGCVQDGEILAKMFMTYNISQTPSFKRDNFHDCMNTTLTRIGQLMNKDTELHSRFFIMYREFVDSKECIGEIDEGDVTLMKAIESILGEVANSMKCINTQDETAVLCKDIDVNLPDVPKICPLKTLDEEKQPLQKTLLEGISWCLTSTLLDEQSLNSVDTLESSWVFFAHNCGKKEKIRECLSEVVTLSSVCLSEAQHNAVKLVDDVLKQSLDVLCVVDRGSSVGYVVYKVLSKTNATVQHNAIRECLTLAHPQREQSGIHIDPADFLRFYQELKVFKGCLINKMHGDNRAVFDVHLFLSTVERSMKCVDPEHGTTVLCEDLDTTPSTEVTVCPLVGRHDTEPLKYDRLLDMSILCMKAATLELDPVKRFTTLEQFQTFFTSFCHNRKAVKRCLGDITALSKTCLTLTDQQLMFVFTDLYDNVLESGCQDDGQVFATVTNGLLIDAEHGIDSDVRQACVNTTSDQFNNYVMETVPKTTVAHYRMFGNLIQCILNGASEAGSFKTAFTTFTSELLREFKCVHPDEGTLVTCQSFVN